MKISSQIIAAAVLIATGATAVGLLANSHARRAMVKQVTAESQRTADMIASDLSTALNDFKTDVRSLSTTPAVAAAASAITPRDAAARRSLDAAYWNQPAARQSLLDTLQMNEAFPWMLAATRRFDPERTRPSKALLAGRDGVLIAAVGTPASLDHAAEPWFVQSMRRGTHFEPPAWDPALAAQAMHYAVRVDDARGVPVGVVRVSVLASSLQSRASQWSTPTKRVAIADPAMPQSRAEARASVKAAGPDALSVSVVPDYDAALAGVDTLTSHLLIVFGVAGLLAIAAGLLASRTLSARVQRLDAYAIKLEAGETQSTVGLKGNDEISAFGRRFEKLSRELAHARERAEKANRAKSALLRQMSHEFRTPLNGVLGYAELLATGQLAPDECAMGVKRNSADLLSLVDRMLDIASLERGELRVQPAPVQLAPVVQAACERAETLAELSGISFSMVCAATQTVMLDGQRVGAVIQCLADNAVRFTDRGAVRVDARLVPEGDTLAFVIRVEDTGIGIAPERWEEVFEPFNRNETGQANRPGAGLGLAVARGLCERMGGELVIEHSVVGLGTVMRARLPTRPVAPDEQTPKGKLSGRVLVVEDGEDNRRLLVFHLKRLGLEVEEARDGLEAWQALEASGHDAFDIILTDMQMPNMDGYELARTLRDAGYDRPVVAVTAHAAPGERAACLKAGCTDYLAKPVTPAALRQTCAKHLRQHTAP